jgi:UDP-N-acetylglucosamine 2-epimerase (non-hydrolysing)
VTASPIVTVVGARPNFVKMAPVVREIARRGLPQVFVHTGQHYDEKMSAVFIDELGMPAPDVYLGVGSGTHAEQTAKVLVAFESLCIERRPCLIVVAGDVNSTAACALAAAKLEIPVAHVESGLRSFDRSMPEEINRVVTDHLADLLFTTEDSGRENLHREGIEASKIRFVGNTMIDSLVEHLPRAKALRPWEPIGVEPGSYGLVTLHRPSNVDDARKLEAIARALKAVSEEKTLLFPVHPRTLKRAGMLFACPGIRTMDPVGYLEFLGLMSAAAFVITDSGGIQEETTALSVRCFTLRTSTERPVTIESGTNELVTIESLHAAVRSPARTGTRVPPLWDGRAAERVVDGIEAFLAPLAKS